MTLGVPLATMLAFLLVLARVSGLVMFLPVPGFRAPAGTIRVVLALSLTLALAPEWPQAPNTLPSEGELVAWIVTEAGFGLATGLAVSFLTEAFQLAAQVLGLQAGYGYASTIDPNSQADAAILQVLVTLVTGQWFFTSGMDRVLIRILAASLRKYPAGGWAPGANGLDPVLRLGEGMFTVGLRLAMPVIAVLLVVDVALALLGRMQQQLQLLSVAFPVKMLATLGLLAALAPALARMFESAGARTISALWRTLDPAGAGP